MNCAGDLSPPWRKINFKKQGAIRKPKIKQNKTTKGIWKNVCGSYSIRRCLEIFAISRRKKNRQQTAVILSEKLLWMVQTQGFSNEGLMKIPTAWRGLCEQRWAFVSVVTVMIITWEPQLRAITEAPRHLRRSKLKEFRRKLLHPFVTIPKNYSSEVFSRSIMK